MDKKDYKAIPFKIQKSKQHALLVQEDIGPNFYPNLHYHPEFQITTIVEGKGVVYAGNNIVDFDKGDVFFIGQNVPHLFKATSRYRNAQLQNVKGISLFFDDFSFGDSFFDIKELVNIKSLLNHSKKVIKVSSEEAAHIHKTMIECPKHKDEERIIAFLNILSSIDKAPSTYINEINQFHPLEQIEGDKLNQVLDYTFKNLNTEISIDQIAKIAFLGRSQFSLFFKKHTNKTYIQFLNELRIENSCMMLRNSTDTIEQICYSSGFKNVSNFTRQFKKLKDSTPSAYRKLWQKR